MKTDLTQMICLGNIKGGAHEAFVDPLQPETTALVIVDMQGPPERTEAEPMRTAVANCVRLLEMARSIPIPVIHVHLGCWTNDSREQSLDKKYYDELRRRRGSGQVDRHIGAPGRQPLPGVEPRSGEIAPPRVPQDVVEVVGAIQAKGEVGVTGRAVAAGMHQMVVEHQVVGDDRFAGQNVSRRELRGSRTKVPPW